PGPANATADRVGDRPEGFPIAAADPARDHAACVLSQVQAGGTAMWAIRGWVVGLVVVGSAGAGRADEPKTSARLPAEVVEAGEKAGFTAGWIAPDKYGYLTFR